MPESESCINRRHVTCQRGEESEESQASIAPCGVPGTLTGMHSLLGCEHQQAVVLQRHVASLACAKYHWTCFESRCVGWMTAAKAAERCTLP